MAFNVINTSIPDVKIIEPKVFGDDRGWFHESFNEKEFQEKVDCNVKFVQDNHSYSKKYTLRGLHYQIEQTQGKLVRVPFGKVLDVAVDLRESSSCFGEWVAVELSDENKRQLWVPPGFAHGFLVLSEDAHFLYKTTDYWHAGSEKTLLWKDSFLGIDWGVPFGFEPTMSEKDKVGFTWESAPKFK